MEKNEALKGFRLATQTAKWLGIGHTLALCCAAAALVVGGLQMVRQFQSE
jgi:hypothetical protein